MIHPVGCPKKTKKLKAENVPLSCGYMVWPRIKLTEEERTMVLAEVVKILAEVMFQNHLYTFGGQVYRQKRGGPIGLRGTCALARLTMCNWDRLREELIRRNRVTLEEYMRYMDNGKSFLYPFRTGLRWVEGV